MGEQGNSSSRSLGEESAAFAATVADSDWANDDLSRLVVNVLYARGSLGRQERRDAASAIRTLQAILKDARALSSEAPPLGCAGEAELSTLPGTNAKPTGREA